MNPSSRRTPLRSALSLLALSAIGVTASACGGHIGAASQNAGATTTASATTSTSTTSSTTTPPTTTRPATTTPATSASGQSGTGSGTRTTTAAPTTTPPLIGGFHASGLTANCAGVTGGVVPVTLSWTTHNAVSVYLSIDGPGKYADEPLNGSTTVEFACGNPTNTYQLHVTDSIGNVSVQIITVKNVTPASTTTSSTA